MLEFVQRAVGYSFAGEIVEQVFFFLYGTSSNGKTFLNTLAKAFGAPSISAETPSISDPRI